MKRKSPPTRPVMERFEDKYSPEPMSGCWLWLGGVSHAGHGVFSYKGKQERAHRVSWLLHTGPVPSGLKVLHSCDNPPCVNPEHLFIGTQADNMADMAAKARSTRGERNPSAKLTSDQVKAILVDPRSQVDIARDYGVTDSCICVIKSGKRWPHLGARQ